MKQHTVIVIAFTLTLNNQTVSAIDWKEYCSDNHPLITQMGRQQDCFKYKYKLNKKPKNSLPAGGGPTVIADPRPPQRRTTPPAWNPPLADWDLPPPAWSPPPPAWNPPPPAWNPPNFNNSPNEGYIRKLKNERNRLVDETHSLMRERTDAEYDRDYQDANAIQRELKRVHSQIRAVDRELDQYRRSQW